MTTQGTPLSRFLRTQLAQRNWTQGDLQVAAGLNKNTVSDLMTGKTEFPSRRTLGKIETALELTPGTLAGLGEDSPPAERPRLADVDDAQLVAELGYRIEDLRRRLAEANGRIDQMEDSAKREDARMEARLEYLRDVDEDNDPQGAWISHEWTVLMYKSSEEGWRWDDVAAYERLCAMIDALVFARNNDLALVPQSEAVAPNVHELEMGVGARVAESEGKRLQAEADELGTESQDPEDWDGDPA